MTKLYKQRRKVAENNLKYSLKDFECKQGDALYMVVSEKDKIVHYFNDQEKALTIFVEFLNFGVTELFLLTIDGKILDSYKTSN